MPVDRRARVLIVEDIVLLAIDLADIITDMGFEVTAFARTVDQGVRCARSGTFDVALLDADLEGRDSGPIADILAARRIPFLFATALDARDLPEGHRTRPRVSKPYTSLQIGHAIGAAITDARSILTAPYLADRSASIRAGGQAPIWPDMERGAA
jgi:CheY-like chemotaxis protein